MTDTHKISVCDGKYTFVCDENFSVTSILRYGEPWSTEEPYNLKYGRAISALCSELHEARSNADVSAAGRTLQSACHGASRAAGWWRHKGSGLDLIAVLNEPTDPVQELLSGALVAQKLCLSHSELSEAMEGHRKGLMDDKLPHRKMIEVELADAVIRIADLAGALSLDLGEAIAEKMAFNAVRPDHKAEAREADGGKAY